MQGIPPDQTVENTASAASPFVTIWTRPRQTVRRIVAERPDLHVLLLAGLFGIGRALDRAAARDLGDHLPTAMILGMALILGPLGGWFSLWIFSHLIRWTGAWIGGTGNREHVKTAIAWGVVPIVFVLPLWIPMLLLLGSEMFTGETPRLEAQPLLLFFFMAAGLIQLMANIWSLMLLCHTVAEAQGFRSAWRGLANLLLSGAVFLIPVMLLVLILMAVTG
jgi:hypothetical protein